MKPRTQTQYLTIEELQPSVDLASLWQYQTNQWFTYRIPSHHLMLIENGRIDARTPHGNFTAKTGDLMCFRPADSSEYGNIGPVLYYQAHINFAPPPMHQLTPWLDEKGPLPLLVPMGDLHPEMRRNIEALCLDIGQRGAAHRLRASATVFQMLALAATALTGKPEPDIRLDPWQRIQLRLGSELSAEVSIKELAREMTMSKDNFIRQFRKRFGCPPKTYRIRAKLREAARLLGESDMSIKAVAFQLGFCDTKTFSRMFRDHIGVPPTVFRLAPDVGSTQPNQKDALFPINRHIIPPGKGQDWFKKWSV